MSKLIFPSFLNLSFLPSSSDIDRKKCFSAEFCCLLGWRRKVATLVTAFYSVP